MENLKKVLLLNAITSAGTGLLLVLFSGFVSELLEANVSSIITSVGIFLVLYAVYVVYTALKILHHTPVVIVLDVLWVVGSAIVLVVYGSEISMIGNLLIFGVAVWVGLMAFLQKKFSRGVTWNHSRV